MVALLLDNFMSLNRGNAIEIDIRGKHEISAIDKVSFFHVG